MRCRNGPSSRLVNLPISRKIYHSVRTDGIKSGRPIRTAPEHANPRARPRWLLRRGLSRWFLPSRPLKHAFSISFRYCHFVRREESLRLVFDNARNGLVIFE